MTGRQPVVLFNQGGGMRGLIPAHFMARLEDATGLRMVDMIDVFAGPSTGAILNAALNIPHADHPTRPKYRARHMVRFYEREGARIFPPDTYRALRGMIHDLNNRTLGLRQLGSLMRHGHYDPSHLAGALKALYGDAQLSDSLRSLIVPCYNIDGGPAELVKAAPDAPAEARSSPVDNGGRAVWMKNIRTGCPAGEDAKTPRVLLRDAVMASCAAPTYFPCHSFDIRWHGQTRDQRISGIDGNIFDNPCISYTGAIRRHLPDDAKPIMLVLGTGHTNKSIRREEWNNFGPLGVVDPANSLPLINMFFYAPESALMESFAADLGENLFVFNSSIIDGRPHSPTTEIDDASPANLTNMRNFVEAMLEEKRAEFDRICDLLVRRRDVRQAEKDGLLRGTRKFFSFFNGLRDNDRTTVEDHEQASP